MFFIYPYPLYGPNLGGKLENGCGDDIDDLMNQT